MNMLSRLGLVGFSLLTFYGCKSDYQSDGDSVSVSAQEKVSEDVVLARAKIFLYLYIGREAYKMYDPWSPSPDIQFNEEWGVWNVTFLYPLGAITIQLDPSGEKANYLFQNGRVIRRSADFVGDPSRPPLYTAEDLIELFELEHNRGI